MIKPLTLECKVKDVIIRRVREAHDTNFKELKRVNTILRLPRMCDEFQKAAYKRVTKQKFEQYQA